MIDWNAVFETLPAEFDLDTISVHETASGNLEPVRQANWCECSW